MGWLSALFGSDDSLKTRVRKGQALSSTHDAFSLPTSSPISSHPDAFSPDSLNTPDLDGAASYTYPPPNGSYGYVPTSSRTSSLLPLHHAKGYPPLQVTWNRLRSWLAREYPELGDTLNYGILPLDLEAIEMQFGFSLPSAVRESYLCVNGQEAESAAGCSDGLFFGLTLLPLEDVLEEWRFWREVDDDPNTGANVNLRDMMQSIPPDWVRKEYSQRGWVPLIADKAGNYIGIDLNPAENGKTGQVIVFGRDFDTKVVLWKGDGVTGWAKWLASFVEELESGEGYEIGGNNESEGSEDDVGYESYFYDGRGQGDGGGDSGSGGGLRLTGEYRGWSPLDAWADRSLRKWYDMGIIPDSALQPAEKEKTTPNLIADGVEVSISVTEPAEPSPKNATPDASSTGRRSDLPTISVSRPPAPMPVELPTPTQIRPPSPSEFDSIRFNRDDLESGMHAEQPLISDPPTPLIFSAESPTVKSPSTVPLPVTPTYEPASQPNLDFLVDTQLDSSSTLVDVAVLDEPTAIPPDNVATPTVEKSEDSDVTIRLVGGGESVVGLVDTTAEEEETPASQPSSPPATEGVDNGDTASIHSVASNVSTASVDGKPAKKSKHKKTKSTGLASLKKLGHLSGLRKKDSSSSVKDAAAPTTPTTATTTN